MHAVLIRDHILTAHRGFTDQLARYLDVIGVRMLPGQSKPPSIRAAEVAAAAAIVLRLAELVAGRRAHARARCPGGAHLGDPPLGHGGQIVNDKVNNIAKRDTYGPRTAEVLFYPGTGGEERLPVAYVSRYPRGPGGRCAFCHHATLRAFASACLADDAAPEAIQRAKRAQRYAQECDDDALRRVLASTPESAQQHADLAACASEAMRRGLKLGGGIRDGI